MTNDELLHKWVNKSITEEELKVFKKRPEFDELVALYRVTEDFSAPKMNQNSMLRSILKEKKSGLSIVEKKPSIFSLPKLLKYGIAASILLLAAWFLFPTSTSDIVFVAEKGEKTRGILPDNSTFILNANSQLSYNPDTWSTQRVLTLQGEAFFKVEKGEKFIVKTSNGFVQVLGTQFNVWSREKVLEVSCQAGKVVVLTTQSKMIETLLPNDFLRVTGDKKILKERFSGDDKNSWIAGLSKFKKEQLGVVLLEIENIFDITISSKNINKNAFISCAFQHKNLDLALKTVLMPLKITYKIEGKNVILKKSNK